MQGLSFYWTAPLNRASNKLAGFSSFVWHMEQAGSFLFGLQGFIENRQELAND